MSTVRVRVPESLLERARVATGRADAETAVRKALELANHDCELTAAARRALVRSRREEREGKARRFRTAREALEYLECL